MFDIIIKNGKIYDGSGNPSFYSDVAIKDGKIARVAKNIPISESERVIDAGGLCVTPGFIDSHSHSDKSILTYPDQIEKIEQGITSCIAGQCGSTNAPISRDADPDRADTVGEYGKWNDVYRTMGTFLDIAKDVPQGSNTATLIGNGSIRAAAMGMENREPTHEEMEKMKFLVRDAMEHGALGLSLGLIYPPGCYAKTDELIELAKVCAEYGGILAAHIRNEGANLIKSVEEFISIAKASGCRAVISHHKAADKENHGKVSKTLKMIDDAVSEGYDIYCDVYPYIASHTTLSVTLIPREYHSAENGGIIKQVTDPVLRAKHRQYHIDRDPSDNFDWILVTGCKAYPEYEGLRIPEIAKLHGKDVYETAFDIIRDSENVCSACFFTMREEDVEAVMKHPRSMICTDSGVARDNKVYHPRLRGTFPRVLGRYVREQRVTTLSEMIRKMTWMPAQVYGLRGKGLICEGFDADICIFDADKIIDRADWTDCTKKADGLNYVILGGEVVVEDAVYNGKKCGKVLLKHN